MKMRVCWVCLPLLCLLALLSCSVVSDNPSALNGISQEPVTAAAVVQSVKIEAESYSAMNGIQTEACSEGTLNIGWIDTGDWVEYTVNVPASAQYAVEYRVASQYSSGQFDFIAGGQKLAVVTVPNTGGWQNWTSITKTLALTAGQQKIRLNVTGALFNMNWFSLTASGVSTSSAVSVSSKSSTDVVSSIISSKISSQKVSSVSSTVSSSVSSVYGGVSLRLQMVNGTTAANDNTIAPRYRLFNSGVVSADLKQVVIRYYYTIDGDRQQTFWCDWSQVGSANVNGTFIKLSNPSAGADTALDVSFTAAAGALTAGSMIEIQDRIAKVDWSSYYQTDDYSFNSAGSTFIDWQKAVVFYGGVRVWGVEPGQSSSISVSSTSSTQIVSSSSSKVSSMVSSSSSKSSLVSSSSSKVSSSSSVSTSSSKGSDKIGVIWASWSPYHFQNYMPYLDKVESYSCKRLTLVPTYFLDTYEKGIQNNPANTPTLAQQKLIIKEMLRRKFTIGYRPHLDPFKFTLDPQSQLTYNKTIPGGYDWRGNFLIDPMKTDYKDTVILSGLKMLAEAVNEIRAENPSLVINPIRFDLGAELMDSEINFTASWLQLLNTVRTALNTQYASAAPYIQFSHNFAHHIEYLSRIPSHIDWLKRLSPAGTWSEAALEIERMTPAAKQTLGQYIAGLDIFTISQYMPLDIFTPAGTATTPEQVRDALQFHEQTFINEVIVKELGVSRDKVPAFQLGEFGMGILGLKAPNVWDREGWNGRPELLSDSVQRLHAETAAKGLVLYMKDQGTVSGAISYWLSGNPYDIFGLNDYSTQSYNPGAANAIKAYLQGQ